MFETYYEQQAAKSMASKDGYEDYKDKGHMYSVCKIKGVVKDGEPKCARNPEGLMASRTIRCLYYRSNKGSFGHCDHRYPPE